MPAGDREELTRVLFLIRSLAAHGAERQLLELVKAMDKSRFGLTVATFYEGGARWADVAALPRVRLVCLQKAGRWDLVSFSVRALRLVRQLQPTVIYSFAQEPNLVALLVGWLTRARVIWGIRRSTRSLPRDDLVDLVGFQLGAALSRLVHRVVYNSRRGRNLYLQRGYSTHNAVVIPNGFDTELFRPDSRTREEQRKAWHVGDEETLVGIVGRLHPVKDHPLFLRAAAQIAADRPEVRFVCIGSGSYEYLKHLRALAAEQGLEQRVLWPGECQDMVAAYNALDMLALCSTEEGFPNAVGEAMACGVPCVVTDAGDAALLVGNTGLVVPPADTHALATAWSEMLALPAGERRHRGTAARARVEREYSLAVLARSTMAILEGLT